jgi:hypothetical protein
MEGYFGRKLASMCYEGAVIKCVQSCSTHFSVDREYVVYKKKGYLRIKSDRNIDHALLATHSKFIIFGLLTDEDIL